MSDLHIEALQTLLEQSGLKRDNALAQHQRALGGLQAAEVHAKQLAGYRREYTERFGAQVNHKAAVELLHCYHGFMARLDDAVAQQQRAVAQAGQRADQAREALLEAELRVASVRKLIERREATVALAAAKRDQKATDELGSRAAWMRQQASGGGLFGLA